MNPLTSDAERKKFRGQFSDKEWAALLADTAFEFEWDAGDLVRAGELCGNILRGTREKWMNKKRAKARKQDRERMKEMKHQERLKEALEVFRRLTDGDKDK
jgi:hypothetical protein